MPSPRILALIDALCRDAAANSLPDGTISQHEIEQLKYRDILIAALPPDPDHDATNTATVALIAAELAPEQGC